MQNVIIRTFLQTNRKFLINTGLENASDIYFESR